MVDKYLLDGDTGLAGIAEPAGCATLCGELQISVRFDNHARVPSKLQYDLFLPALGFQHPSDRRTASEAEQFEARIDDKLFGHRIVAGQHIETAWRKASLHRDLPQQQRGQRSLRSRLNENRIPSSQRRSDFMSD